MDQAINLLWLGVAGVLAIGGISTWITVRNRREEKARQDANTEHIREQVRQQKRKR